LRYTGTVNDGEGAKEIYRREILEPPLSPVENGEFIQGTWNKPFRNVDLLSIRKPYKIPLPRWARDGRLKEWESFIVEEKSFHLDAFIANLKYFRIAQLVLYDKESGERYRFRKILPLSGWHLPRNMYSDSINSRSWRFFFRIHDWLDAGTIRVDIDVEAWGKRPPLSVQLTFEAAGSLPMTTTAVQDGLPFYSYKLFSPVHGDLVFGGSHFSFKHEETTGFFRDSKGFYRYLSSNVWCAAAGFTEKGRRCGFSLTAQSGRGQSKHNENAFWSDGELTPLPPVKITQPEGMNKKWVIQDVEGMVDLGFTPAVPAASAFNFALLGAEYQTPLGIYSGFLLNSKGERVPVRGLWGLGEKLSLRV
jgi:hypothetical protein